MKKLANSRMSILTMGVLILFIFTNNAFALINIVAAENVYGEVAQELGGSSVAVISILKNPNQDPHLFTTSPSQAVIFKNADIIIYNGADYDPWMKSLLANQSQKTKAVIVIADLMKVQSGANPHLWYLPETIPAFARYLTQILSQVEPANQAYFQGQLKQFDQSYQPVLAKIHSLKQAYQGTPVIATEPVFNYMATSMGLQMQGLGFQTSIMNDVPPTISQIKAFEDALRQHQVRLLIYNSQVVNPTTRRMMSLAQEQGIPIVGVTEMMPAGSHYVPWIMNELDQVERVLKPMNSKH